MVVDIDTFAGDPRRWLARVEAGESLVIEDASGPVAAVTPTLGSNASATRLPPGFARVLATLSDDAFAPTTDEDLNLWYGGAA